MKSSQGPSGQHFYDVECQQTEQAAEAMTGGAYLFTQMPLPSTVPILEVKHRRLGHIDGIRDQGDDEAGQRAEYPPLRAVEHDPYAAPEVLAAAEGLDAVRVGDGVVYPVGAGELVVPDAVGREERALGLGQGVPSVGDGRY